MNAELRFYFALFARKLPLFMLVFSLITSTGVLLALTLPPVYRSQMQIVVESAQISGRLAESTVSTPAREQLQLFESRLLARDNLLEIAQKVEALASQGEMSPDQIVEAMEKATAIRSSSGRDAATTMQITFENHSPQKAAAVLNEYLTFLLNEDAEYRTGRANQTQEFFENEVDRLSSELSEHSARILRFKTENADALPDDLTYFRTQQGTFQERLVQIDREIASLEKQKFSLRQIFEATGNVIREDTEQVRLSPEEQRLQDLKTQLADLEAIYAPESARIRVMKNRIAQLEDSILGQTAAVRTSTVEASPEQDPDQIRAQAVLDVQVAEVDSQISQLEGDRDYYRGQLDELEGALEKIPGNIITLEALERDYDNVQEQYNRAVDRLSTASTGERIESLSRGQRISVIEQPSIPDSPVKPSRMKIAAAGGFGGIVAGLGLIVLIEMLSSTVKRSSDLTNKLGLTPIATIPYMRTRREIIRRRLLRIVLSLAVIAGVPIALWYVHTFYMPFEVILQKVSDRFGFYI